jgi:DNA-binding NtrC family response regulator
MASNEHVVLLVDDEPVNLMMLKHALQGKFNVRTASSGQEALGVLRGESVALLITDQRMPGMTGTELLRQSRQLCPDLICLLLTAEKDMDTLMSAIAESGAMRVINKPWNPEEIVSSIEAALDQYENRRKKKQVMDQLARANQILNRVVKNR